MFVTEGEKKNRKKEKKKRRKKSIKHTRINVG